MVARAQPRTLDSSYALAVERLSPALRLAATGLLQRLGLGSHAEGRWEHFLRLEVHRDLPVFAAGFQAGEGCRGIGREVLEGFLAAHHSAIFFGTLADRRVDGQVTPDPELRALERCFLESWREALARAEGDRQGAEEAIRRGLRAWRRGVSLERAALARRVLTPRLYADIVLRKLGCAWLASERMLQRCGEHSRSRAFRQASGLLLLGMQCVDDAMDCAEDEALHAVSVPAALGLPARGLTAAAVALLRRASEVAHGGGFERLADWLCGHAEQLEARWVAGGSLQERWAGWALGTSLEERCFELLPLE